MHPAWFYSMKIPKALDLHPKNWVEIFRPSDEQRAELESRIRIRADLKAAPLGFHKLQDTVSEK